MSSLHTTFPLFLFTTVPDLLSFGFLTVAAVVLVIDVEFAVVVDMLLVILSFTLRFATVVLLLLLLLLMVLLFCL